MNWLDRILQQPYFWDYLSQVTKPIVLYGMGNGADAILDRCAALDIPVAGVFASDEFVRGQQFRGYPVLTYKQAKAQWGEFVLLIAFASERPEILRRFFHLAQQQETYAPHLPLFGDTTVVTPQWLRENRGVLERVHAGLADDLSRQVLEDILSYKLTGKLEYLARVTRRQDDLTSLFTFGEEEAYADLGAYNGDTLREFLDLTEGHYDHLYAVEPDLKNFRKLQAYVEEEQLGRCTLVPEGIWAQPAALPFAAKGGRMSSLEETGKKVVPVPVTSLDALVGNHDLTYVKMDVEGVEKETLAGGECVITRCAPKLLVAGYHHDDDLWEIPLELWALRPDYKVYLRRHPYVPCWEINFFVTL